MERHLRVGKTNAFETALDAGPLSLSCAFVWSEMRVLCCVLAQVLGADKDEWSQTRQQIGASIDICMGGRVAEELVFGSDQVRVVPVHVRSHEGSSLALARHVFIMLMSMAMRAFRHVCSWRSTTSVL